MPQKRHSVSSRIERTMDRKIIGQLLQDCRKGLPCSVQDLAKVVNQPVQVIAAIELGLKRPSLELINKICLALNIPKSHMRKRYYPSLF